MPATIDPPKGGNVARSNRVFIVRKPYGPWTNKDPERGGKPNVFDEETFRKLHPIPTKDRDGKPAEHPFDHATYHDDLLDRAIELGCIVLAPPGTEVTPTPLGPGNTSRGVSSPIRESLAASKRDKEIRATIETGMKPVDPLKVQGNLK